MKKIAFGVIIVMLGIFLLFRNLEYIPNNIFDWVFSWQSLLIALGAIFLFDRKTDNKNFGVILILVGTVFLLTKIMIVPLGNILVPALVIALGLFVIIQVTTRKRGRCCSVHYSEWKEYDCKRELFNKTTIDSKEYVKREYVFSGSKEKWNFGKLCNAKIEAVFSNVELDLSQTELSEEFEGTARIKVSAVFSGVILYVPNDWNIFIQKTGVFGGFVDNRPQNSGIDKGKTVILELEAIFSGGEIRCTK